LHIRRPQSERLNCMDATPRWNLSPARSAGIAFGLATQVVFLVTVCALFLFLRDGVNHLAANWLAIDGILALQFAVAHSVLLLPRTRKIVSRVLPSSMFGCLFCLATCAGLWLVFRFWRSSNGLLWEATGNTRLAVLACFYASWVALFYSLSLSGFGYQTGFTQWRYWWQRQPLPTRGLVNRSLFLWLRHPAYLCFLGLIWFTPRMTYDHLVLTTVWTVYVFVGSYLKDQRMAFYLGDTYREYASRVPGYPGFLIGPLGRWRPPAVTVPTATLRDSNRPTATAA
jgi:protein-S-isoprenylcysteine O-methyltransferase Ste14